MLSVGKNLYIGGASEEYSAHGVDAILNVACDLTPTRRSSSAREYVHVGLVDGPGNPLTTYVAAVTALASLLSQGKKTLVCCHGGHSRSVAVVLMYYRFMNTFTDLKWQDCLETFCERVDDDVEEPHTAHREAFDAINWAALQMAVRGKR